MGGLGRFGYDHHVVNHSQNFVDPITGTCTNAVEAYWSRLKAWMRRHGIQHSQLIESYLDEFMWRDIYANGDLEEAFTSYLKHLKAKFNVE